MVPSNSIPCYTLNDTVNIVHINMVECLNNTGFIFTASFNIRANIKHNLLIMLTKLMDNQLGGILTKTRT